MKAILLSSSAGMLLGLFSYTAMATAIGVLIEVPVILMLIGFCVKTAPWFKEAPGPGKAAAPDRS